MASKSNLSVITGGHTQHGWARTHGGYIAGRAYLDAAATAAGKAKLSPQVWEVALADGSVAAIVPSDEHAAEVRADGRQVSVYSLEEIGRLLTAFPEIAKAKATFPGAEVTQIAKRVNDPLDAIHDSDTPLDDRLDDIA
jgi:hypothetical protein